MDITHHPGLTYRTIYEITRTADQMAHDGEILIESNEKLFLDVVELGSLYDFSHESDDPLYERRVRAYARTWFQMNYPTNGEPAES